jgi:3-dehydroquinate dehydratase-2
MTLADIEQAVTAHAKTLGLKIVFRQSNHEGELVDWIQEARTKASGLIINAAAYSHTSVAILDALRTVEKPIIEVHLSNLFRREPYRRHSYVTDAATGLICGLKDTGYLLAVDAIARLIKVKTK